MMRQIYVTPPGKCYISEKNAMFVLSFLMPFCVFRNDGNVTFFSLTKSNPPQDILKIFLANIQKLFFFLS